LNPAEVLDALSLLQGASLVRLSKAATVRDIANAVRMVTNLKGGEPPLITTHMSPLYAEAVSSSKYFLMATGRVLKGAEYVQHTIFGRDVLQVELLRLRKKSANKEEVLMGELHNLQVYKCLLSEDENSEVEDMALLIATLAKTRLQVTVSSSDEESVDEGDLFGAAPDRQDATAAAPDADEPPELNLLTFEVVDASAPGPLGQASGACVAAAETGVGQAFGATGGVKRPAPARSGPLIEEVEDEEEEDEEEAEEEDALYDQVP
jgi:hypothetical protein